MLPAALVSRGNVSDSPVLAAEGKAVCLYSAIGNLHSRHPLSKPPSDGPFSVADFNTRMLSSNSMDSYLYLHHIHAEEFDQSRPGVLGLICHESIEEVGHFYAVRINGDEVAICDDTIGVVLNTTMDGFKELAIEYDLTLFQLCETRDRSEHLHATDGVYALVGGGVHSRKRPASSMEDNPTALYTDLTKCVHCKGADLAINTFVLARPFLTFHLSSLGSS